MVGGGRLAEIRKKSIGPVGRMENVPGKGYGDEKDKQK
jgi:hypothetical protein